MCTWIFFSALPILSRSGNLIAFNKYGADVADARMTTTTPQREEERQWKESEKQPMKNVQEKESTMFELNMKI